MTADERLALLNDRLRHLEGDWIKPDRILLERMWARIDWALDHEPLYVYETAGPNGGTRVVTALGIIRYLVDLRHFRISGEAKKADGHFHPIGSCLHTVRLFQVKNCAHWWLRFAFQTWEPQCSGIDLIDDPGNRPCNIELDTSKLIMWRLVYDRRFQALVKDFDDALGLPSFVRSLIEEEARELYCNVDRASEIWQAMEEVTAGIQRVINGVRASDSQ
jgi:hypothetical protein